MPSAGETSSEPRGLHHLRGPALLALALVVVWSVLYHTVIGPDGRVEDFLCEVLTGSTYRMMDALGFPVTLHGATIISLPESGWGTAAAVEVVRGCSGLGAMALFVLFVLVIPGRWTRRMGFIPIGIVVLMIVNTMRIGGLLVLSSWRPAWFDSVHQFGTHIAYYGVVFVLWMLWARWGGGSLRLSSGRDDGKEKALPSSTLAQA